MAKDQGSLKRLGGGRWETRDGRFAIEPQSGTWVIVDNENTDDLGLPLVRGPYPSLTAAKEAIASARDEAPAASPLAERLASAKKASKARAAGRKKASPPEPPPPPPEPKWLTDLDAGDRRRARDWIRQLGEAGFDDAEEIARDEVARGRPAVVRAVLARRLGELGADAESIRAVIGLVADGGDRSLRIRWRLVDGDGRALGELDLPG